MKMATFGSNSLQADLQYSQRSKERLLILRHQSHNSFRRRRVWRVVDLFRTFKVIANLLKRGFQVWTFDSAAKTRTITKEQRFKFVHDDKRDEPVRVKIIA